MKFEAINIKNEKVIGTGVALSEESIEGWSGTENVEENVKKYGKSLSFLFENSACHNFASGKSNKNRYEHQQTSLRNPAAPRGPGTGRSRIRRSRRSHLSDFFLRLP